ncbi:MAG: CoA transferase, partial [Chloroflexi bacterium]|nr:CoA transferase [Chloroflexota bacterium]
YMAPHGCYRCQGQDKWVAIAIGSDEEWEAFCAVIGRPAWTREERFASQIDRWRNQDSLDGLVERWTVEHDHHEAMQLLQAAGVAAGAVLNAEEFVNDPHLKERGFFVNINQPDVGTRPYPGLPIRLSKTPVTAWRPAPGLGEHNEYVLGDLMGLSLRELVELEQAQVIGQQPPAGPGMLL